MLKLLLTTASISAWRKWLYRKVLQLLLSNTGLHYELVNSNIIIKKVKEYSPPLIPVMDVQSHCS